MFLLMLNGQLILMVNSYFCTTMQRLPLVIKMAVFQIQKIVWTRLSQLLHYIVLKTLIFV